MKTTVEYYQERLCIHELAVNADDADFISIYVRVLRSGN